MTREPAVLVPPKYFFFGARETGAMGVRFFVHFRTFFAVAGMRWAGRFRRLTAPTKLPSDANRHSDLPSRREKCARGFMLPCSWPAALVRDSGAFCDRVWRPCAVATAQRHNLPGETRIDAHKRATRHAHARRVRVKKKLAPFGASSKDCFHVRRPESLSYK